jgi:uncharacterized phage protein (TIGR02218 family)
MTMLPQALRDHLAGRVTTVCFCWIVRRADGAVLGFTDHDRTLEIEGVACEPSTGFSAGTVESSLGYAGDTSEVAGALSSDRIGEADIRAGKYDGARIEQYLVNWASPADHALIKRHIVGEIRRTDGAFRVELRSLSAKFDERHGRFFLRTCDAELGDARCGVDASGTAYNAPGTVVSIDGAGALTVVGLEGYAESWFAHGRLTWVSGQREGAVSTVAFMKGGAVAGQSVLRLFEPDVSGIVPGDAFTLRAGCDKRFETCRAKFSNGVNFQGFPHIPGNDAALTYADEETDFDGGPLVP